MEDSDIRKFLEEVVGYRKLGELVEGRLRNVVSEAHPEDVKQEILIRLADTLLGTMELEIDLQERAVYTAGLAVPKIVPIETVRGYQEAALLESSGFSVEERHATEAYDLVVPVETQDSKMYERFLTDSLIDTSDDGLNPVRGVPENATHAIGDFDHMFTTYDVFLGVEQNIGERGEKAIDFLREAFVKARFPKGSYSVIKVAERGKDKADFSRGYGEFVLVNGRGYTLVFRPFGNIHSFSVTGDARNYPAGTMIYFDGTRVDTGAINKLVGNYARILNPERKERD